MVLAKNPIPKKPEGETDARALDFIAGAAPVQIPSSTKRTAKFNMRLNEQLLKRIDANARRLGLSRTAFLTLAASEKLERMEN